MSLLEGLTLGMQEIADLAGVRRPVVSMWRKRNKGGETPFPEPIDAGVTSPHFWAADVADWIERRGAGNNPDFRADLAVHAALSDGDPARSLDTVTALLALAPYTSVPLNELDSNDLADLADDVDPLDAFAYREVASLGEHAPAAARHAYAVASAAYNPANAIETLLAARYRVGDPRLTTSVLRPAVLKLVADVLWALVPRDAELVVADPNPGCGDLLAAVLGRAERIEPVAARLPVGDNGVLRLAQRRLVAHGWSVSPWAPDDEAHIVTQVPALGEPDLDPAEVLNRVDDVALCLPFGCVGVVVGPAAALVDQINDRAPEAVRDTMLRSGRVRSVIQLPPGLVTSRPRQTTALWVLGDATPGASFAEQHLVVADLSDHAPERDAFASDVVADLLTDVVAAQGTLREAAAHHFRFGRFLRPSEIVAGSQSLLGAAQPLNDGTRPDPAGVRHRIDELEARVSETSSGPNLPSVQVTPQGISGGRFTIEQLYGRGALRRLPGHRIRPEDVRRRVVLDGASDSDGTALVIGVAEVLGDVPWGARRIDKLRFGEGYPAGRFTEPGDVIFVAAPRPVAAVDVEGFSVVESPARILRVPDGARGRLVPDVIAADICAVGEDAKQPDAWQVRGVPADQGSVLEGALSGLREQEAELRARLGSLAELRRTLVDGVAAGVIRLDVSGPGENMRTMREEG